MNLKLDLLQGGWVTKRHCDHSLLQVFDIQFFLSDLLLILLRVCETSELVPKVPRHLVDLCKGIFELLHNIFLPATVHLLVEQVCLLLACFDLKVDALAQVFKGDQQAIFYIVFDSADENSISTVPREVLPDKMEH